MMGPMDKIEPLKDHQAVARFNEGDQVRLGDKTYTIWSKTTLASGEPALVLQGEGEQFVMRASQFLEEIKAA